MGIENIDILKGAIQDHWYTPVPRAYVFVQDNRSAGTTHFAMQVFYKIIKERSVGFYTAADDWVYGLNPQKGDLLCFYNVNGQLRHDGVPLEDAILKELRKNKLMMVLEAKDCYEILEAR